MLLYKYRSSEQLNFVADILVHERLFCSLTNELNDPFEGHCLYSRTLQMYEDEERTIPVTGKGRPAKAILTTPGHHIADVRELLEGWRVCSLSATAADVRLWSLYGGAHRGVAIALDLEVSNSAAEEMKAGIFKVDTSPSLPQILDGKDLLPKDLLTSKIQIWDYEQEYRILTKSRYFNVKGSIKAVILGPRMDDDHVEIIRRMAGCVPLVKSRLNMMKATVEVPEW